MTSNDDEFYSQTEAQLRNSVMIRNMIEAPGFKIWASVINALMKRYEGTEDFLDDDEHSFSEGVRVVFDFARTMNKPDMMTDISDLPIFHYRVQAREKKELWQPLEESYQDFITRNEKPLIAYTPNQRTVDKESVMLWLSKAYKTETAKEKNATNKTIPFPKKK